MLRIKRPSVGALIQEIIAQASDRAWGLENVLLKAQVLGARFGNPELSTWAKSEVDGYTDTKQAPPYRQIPVRFRGDCIGHGMGYVMQGPQDIPMEVVPEDLRDEFRSVTILQGVTSVESLARNESGKTPRIPIEPGVARLVREMIRGPEVTSVYLEIAPSSLESLLSAVRSRLLDLVLALDAEFGEEPPEKPSDLGPAEREFVQRIVHLHIAGDGNAVAFESPSARQCISIEQGDWPSLESELLRLGVPQNDIAELKADEAGALSWLKRLSRKAGSGAWKAATRTTMAEVTKAVLAFAGLPT